MPADKTCGVTFSANDDLFVMVSQEGYIFSMKPERLPAAIEEVIHLGITDHIVATFTISHKHTLLFITQNGKAVNREASWLEETTSFKTKGQPLLSKERRESGIRIVGAAAVDDKDWSVILHSDGSLSLYRLEELLSSGSLAPNLPGGQILSFSAFRMPEKKS